MKLVKWRNMYSCLGLKLCSEITHNTSGSVPLTHMNNSLSLPLKGSLTVRFLSAQVDEISITVFLLSPSTPQPLLSGLLHFLAIIIMKFAEVFKWIKSHQRPFSVQRRRSIKWCDVSIPPVPQFRGLFSHHFGGD